jgi:hypothetical protein
LLPSPPASFVRTSLAVYQSFGSVISIQP